MGNEPTNNSSARLLQSKMGSSGASAGSAPEPETAHQPERTLRLMQVKAPDSSSYEEFASRLVDAVGQESVAETTDVGSIPGAERSVFLNVPNRQDELDIGRRIAGSGLPLGGWVAVVADYDVGTGQPQGSHEVPMPSGLPSLDEYRSARREEGRAELGGPPVGDMLTEGADPAYQPDSPAAPEPAPDQTETSDDLYGAPAPAGTGGAADEYTPLEGEDPLDQPDDSWGGDSDEYYDAEMDRRLLLPEESAVHGEPAHDESSADLEEDERDDGAGASGEDQPAAPQLPAPEPPAPPEPGGADVSMAERVSTVRLDPDEMARAVLPVFAPTKIVEALADSVETDLLGPTQSELLALAPAVGFTEEDAEDPDFADMDYSDDVRNDAMIVYMEETSKLSGDYANDRATVRALTPEEYRDVQGWAVELLNATEPKRLRNLDDIRNVMAGNLAEIRAQTDQAREAYAQGMQRAMEDAAMEAAESFAAANRSNVVDVCDAAMTSGSKAVAGNLLNHAFRAYETLMYAERKIQDPARAREIFGRDVDLNKLRAYLSASRYRAMSDRAMAHLVESLTASPELPPSAPEPGPAPAEEYYPAVPVDDALPSFEDGPAALAGDTSPLPAAVPAAGPPPEAGDPAEGAGDPEEHDDIFPDDPFTGDDSTGEVADFDEDSASDEPIVEFDDEGDDIFEEYAAPDDGDGGGGVAGIAKKVAVGVVAAAVAVGVGFFAFKALSGPAETVEEGTDDPRGIFEVGEQYQAQVDKDGAQKVVRLTITGFSDSSIDENDHVVMKDEDGIEYRVSYEQLESLRDSSPSGYDESRQQTSSSSGASGDWEPAASPGQGEGDGSPAADATANGRPEPEAAGQGEAETGTSAGNGAAPAPAQPAGAETAGQQGQAGTQDAVGAKTARTGERV